MIQKLFNNSISNVAILLLRLGVSFVLTPCILKALGKHEYGIYEIVLSVVGYMGMLELGMQPAVTRFIARYAAVNDEEKLKRIFSSALVFSTAIGALVAVALMLWAFAGAQGLVPPNAPSSRYTVFLTIVACQVLISFPGNVITSVHHGHQRYWLTSGLTAVNTVVGTSIIYFFLKHGYGLLVLTLANTIGFTLKFINYYLLLRLDKYGGYRFAFKYVSADTIRELVGFGFKSFALGIATRIRNSTDSLVIGTVLSPSAVAYYVMPSNLVNQLRNFISAATLGFMPFFSELNANSTPEKTREVYYTSSRYMVGVVVCGFIAIGFLGPRFLDVWIGSEYGQEGRLILYILAFATFIQMINPFHGRILTGIGKHGVLAKIRTYEAIVNLLISIVLAKIIGKEGVAIGTLLPALIAEPLILYIVCKQIAGQFFDYLIQALLPSLLPCIITALFYYVLIANFNPIGYGGIFIVGVSGSVLFVLSFIILLHRDERCRLFNIIKTRSI
ncbi:oligosaccharide flippase family protein [Geobacter pelophilus]|uniref:Oligosaccharide flippase family protein n=1 Tax=Geoanaerobacter pelophilus TaxID=60036 RepID=A0AAW4KVN9_9BACT|nr:oligosaccharide flippase family protein [Geoanaerobacter pelophilus]MBT0662719.1 oligosaccharide flippase family protein [Geoanaerobacter pelophilus]